MAEDNVLAASAALRSRNLRSAARVGGQRVFQMGESLRNFLMTILILIVLGSIGTSAGQGGAIFALCKEYIQLAFLWLGDTPLQQCFARSEATIVRPTYSIAVGRDHYLNVWSRDDQFFEHANLAARFRSFFGQVGGSAILASVLQHSLLVLCCGLVGRNFARR
jgi:hypothetical protein